MLVIYSGGQLFVQHISPEQDNSTPIGKITMKLVADIHDPQRRIPDIADSLNFDKNL